MYIRVFSYENKQLKFTCTIAEHNISTMSDRFNFCSGGPWRKKNDNWNCNSGESGLVYQCLDNKPWSVVQPGSIHLASSIQWPGRIINVLCTCWGHRPSLYLIKAERFGAINVTYIDDVNIVKLPKVACLSWQLTENE